MERRPGEISEHRREIREDPNKVVQWTASARRQYSWDVGEHIGVEYLYQQTGKVLQDYKDEIDTAVTVEDEEDDHLDMDMVPEDDPTLAPLVATSPVVRQSTGTHTSTPVQPSTSPSIKPVELAPTPRVTPVLRIPDQSEYEVYTRDSVGPDNVGGYDKVQELADFLIQRRDEHSLSGAQAILFTRKWRFLDDFDKQPTTFSPSHRSRLTSGRFKAKATGVVPGVDSTRRCFLGQNTGPAQWPDCNRYVEAIISRLCELYPGNERTPQGSIIMRWTLISRAYNKIRQLVLNNARVMENTEPQLPEINNTTLSQWYNRRAKKQERQVLQQGITLTPPPMTASQVLPPPSQSQPDMASSHGDQHMFDLPINKAGMASTRKKATKERDSRPLVSQTYGLKLPDGSVRILQLPGNIVDISSPPPSAPAAISSQTPLAPQAPPLAPLAPLTSVQHPPPPIDFTSHPLPYSTYRNRKRKGAPVRDYHRQTQVIKCGKCGGDRSGPDHHLYFMNVYCAKTDGVSLEAWKATMKVKYRNQRRRRSSDQ
ncbi:hypothetical protein FSP39_019003 [Pinctada imbricata]|uniref:Uncharacterized protein n=1 Tax=Pinctada imbricata TaxID=66713 RepID=A0AA88Y1B3_PINIB|nr:hypothetical protein FSP39_019003 [Pinctada imbricata]